MRSIFSIALLWAGYAVGFYGYCLLRNYDISALQVIRPNPYGVSTVDPKTGAISKSGAIQSWPPMISRNDVVFPTGESSTNVSGKGVG